MPLLTQQNSDVISGRTFRFSARLARQLLLLTFVLLSCQASARCQIQPDRIQQQTQPELRPDGAPGENSAPGADGERFAQVGDDKEAAEPEAADAVEVFAEENSEPADDSDDPRSQRNLDNIDFRAPINRSKQTVWQKIERAAEGRGWDEVLQRLSRFAGPVDGPVSEDYVVRHADGSVQSSRLSIAKLLGRMPENIRVARARAEATLGKTLLDQAIQENSLRQLNQVAVRFFGTSVGYRAADRLAAQLIDQGEFVLASEWLKLLQNSDAKFKESPAWQKKTNLILSLTTQPHDQAAVSETLKSLREQFVSSEPATLSQWPLLGGNSRRHAEPDLTSRPVMLRRWEFPTTSNSGLRATLKKLIEDLSYRSVPTVPAAVPIFIDGKLVCRTFRGIEVLDVETGQHLWTTARSASVERLLASASPDARSIADLTENMTPLLSAAAAVDRTGGPIGQFLFQNAAHGLISSDRKRVYYLEDDPVFTLGRTSIRRGVGGNASPRPDSTTSNRLKAYDLETGEPVWQVGGPETDEPFAPELAGWFFLGAPLPDRGDLFIVAQRENMIRLFCLDPATGSARWSQQIAFAEEGLERNLNRRLWSLQLASAHGIIVCPTSVGWLVGVDRSTGTIVWSHRYSERAPANSVGSPRLFRRNRGGIQLANESIGGTWVPSAPIIMGDRVVIAPAEPREETDGTTRFLDCVSVFTGERIWSLPREQALAVTGAAHGETIVTWPGSIVILKPDGKTRAEIEFDSDDGLPCGRGVVADGSFWLPLQKNVLLRFDLEQAKLAERIELADGYPALGNLAFYQGLLISHAPGGITAWELEETLDSRLATIRSSGDEGTADVLQAQLALSRKEYSQAIELLLPRLLSNPDTILHESILRLLMQAASGQVRSSPEKSLSLLEQVQPIFEASGVEGVEFELQRRQLEIEALLQAGRSEVAVEKLLDLASTSLPGSIERFDDSKITTAVDPWLTRRFQIIWEGVPTSEKDRISTRIKSVFDNVARSETTTFTPERLATLFSFHADGQKAARRLADEAIAEKRFVGAEHWLSQVENAAESSRNPETLLRMLKLRSDFEIYDSDTRELASRLQAEFSKTVISDGTTVAGVLEPLLAQLQKFSSGSVTDWGDINLRGVRSAASPQQDESPRLIADRPSNRFRIETSNSRTSSNRLSFFDRATNELFWTVSLRSNDVSTENSGQRLSVYQTGQLYAVVSRGVLNMLSLPDRRVLWTQPIEELDNARRSSAKRGQPLQDVNEWMLRQRPGSLDAVPVINSSYVCSRATRSLSVFDVRTGELRWRLEPLERSLRICGTGDTILLTRPDGTISAAHNATDGQPVDAEDFLFDRSESDAIIKVSDHSVVTIANSEDDDSDPAVVLRATNLATQEELWRHEFSTKVQVRMISNDQLAILAPRGLLKLLDFRTGELTEFDKIFSKLRRGDPSFSILSDGSRLYVIVKLGSASTASRPALPNIRLSGYVVAFDLETGQLLWPKQAPGEKTFPQQHFVSDQNLITERLDQLPFLIMASHQSNFLLQPNDFRDIKVLDKRDGRVLFEAKNEPGKVAFRSMIIDTDNRHVDLISSDERLRLKAIPHAQ